MNHQSAWEQCLSIIRDNINEQSFQTWFKPIKPLSLENKVLTIMVPSPFFHEWIEEHYLQLLRKTIQKVIGKDVKLDYRIVVENSSTPSNPSTVTIPSQAKGYRKQGQNTNMSVNVGRSMNPFVIPGIKKINIDSQLNRNFTFESFIEGDSNRLARSAGLAVSDKPGNTAFNPLFVYGGVGLGKTHLIQAIGNEVEKNFKNKVVLYVTSEKFTNQFVQAVSKNTVNDFLNFYQMIDVLIIDDIQFFAKKEKTQEIFFHIFNRLFENKKQIILSSDSPPKDLEGLEERLLSRFKCGLQADIQPPEYETRLAILRNKMQADGIELPEDVIEFIAQNITDNVRELQGALISLLAQSSLSKKDISIQDARKLILNFTTQEAKTFTVPQIQQVAAKHFKVTVEDLKSKSRKKAISTARQFAVFLSKKLTEVSLKEIGKHFGGRDHSTVLHACSSIDKKIKDKQEIREVYETLMRKLEFGDD